MSKIEVELSMTLHIGPIAANEYAKFSVKITDIDPNTPELLEDIPQTIHKAMEVATTALENKFNEVANIKITRA